jgi:hypothetical protein
MQVGHQIASTNKTVPPPPTHWCSASSPRCSPRPSSPCTSSLEAAPSGSRASKRQRRSFRLPHYVSPKLPVGSCHGEHLALAEPEGHRNTHRLVIDQSQRRQSIILRPHIGSASYRLALKPPAVGAPTDSRTCLSSPLPFGMTSERAPSESVPSPYSAPLIIRRPAVPGTRRTPRASRRRFRSACSRRARPR